MTDQSVIINSLMAPKIVDKQARRAEITLAAAEVFARKGFQGASMDDIAAAAGVSKGTVYGYFENKEELFYATFEAYEGELVQGCAAVIAAQTTARDQLAGCLKLCVASLQQNVQLFPLTLELWAAASTGPARERFAVVMERLYREFRAMTAALVDAGKAGGEFRADVDAQATAAWLVGGLDGMMLQYWFDQSLDVQGWTDNFLTQILRGISADT
jgi:AcrR family transcriptional regulator